MSSQQLDKARGGKGDDAQASSSQNVQDRSSRASSASTPEQTKSQIDFQFLNFSHPSEAKAGKTLKAIRSHVTKKQHQRESAAAAARRAQGGRRDITDSMARSPTIQRSGSQSPEASVSTASGYIASGLASSPDISPVSTSPLHSPNVLSWKQIDPTEVYPDEWHVYLPRIMEHHLTKLAVDVEYIDEPNAAGLLRTKFFPFMLTDLASLHAVMLFAASHYGRFRGSTSHAIDLLKLRGMAIREINVALEDESRATSDQVIAAVAEMAAYEAIFGDAPIFNTHMIGLLRMVSLRGGLPALGLDGLLERVLLWIDANASHFKQTHIYFDKAAFPTAAVHPQPNIAIFTGGLA